MNRLIAGIVGMGVSAALLTGCATSAPAAEPGSGSESEPIKIAVMQGVTGALALLSADFRLGVDAATDEINASGGIAGRQLEVTSIDTRSDATFAVGALNEILQSDSPPDLVVLSGSSAETLASLPALTDAGVFSLGPPSAPLINDPAAYPYHFGVSLTQADVLQTLTDSFSEHKVKTLGILAGADALGDAQVTGVEQAAKTAGVEIVAVERPNMADLNFTVQMQRLAVAKPDAIFADSHSSDALSRMLDARAIVDAHGILLVTGPGASYVGPIRIAEPDSLANCEMPVASFTIAPVVNYLAPLAAAMTAVSAEKSAATVGSGYDTIKIAALALEKTGGDATGAALAEALVKNPIPEDYTAGFPGGTAFTAESHFPENSAGTLRMVPCAAELVDGFWALD